MHESQSGLPTAIKDSSRSALNFLHAQLLAQGQASCGLDELLGGLSSAFQAAGAGLATIEAGGPVLQARVQSDPASRKLPLPWRADSSWEELLRPARGAVHLAAPEQASFLVATWEPVGIAPGLIWLEDGNGREWSAAESTALCLAATVLARRVQGGQDLPGWAAQLDRAARQRQMDLATRVTRRLAHDFGNVMTGILGFTELALAQPLTGNNLLHTYLTEAHRAAQNGALLTHQLRLLPRRQDATNNVTSLATLFAQEEKRYRTQWGVGLPVTLDAGVELPPVALDGQPLRQALNALVENAREAVLAKGSGSVAVSAQLVDLTAAACRDWYGDVRPGPHVEIRVSDNGAGLDPEAARQLFAEPFFSTKMRKRGFGLALAFAVVNGHRGGLDLQSGPQGGTVARLLLPTAPLDSSSKPARVLVVDDDPLILQFVCTTLEQAGYQVRQASCAADAFQSYMTAAPDLVLSDVAMPKENGIDLARRLLSRDANLRLLFMSGKIPNDLADSDFVARHFQLLPKPFRPDGLLKAVRDALDHPVRRLGERLAAPTRT